LKRKNVAAFILLYCTCTKI